MPPQRRKVGLEFFRRFPDPVSWGLRPYLKAKHGDLTPQHILDNWRKSLITILQSTGTDFSEAQRVRAAELLECYKQNVKPFPLFCWRWCCDSHRRCDGSCTYVALYSPSPDTIADGPSWAIRSLVKSAANGPIRSGKSYSLVLYQWGLVVAASLGGSMRLMFDYCC